MRKIGKEAVFERHWRMLINRMYEVKKNTPKSMVSVKSLDNRLSISGNIIRLMDWSAEMRQWGLENGQWEKWDKLKDECREKLGTTDEPIEPFKYNDTDNFRKLTLAYYHEAIMNQGMTHEQFMQRFKNEFSDILDKWEVTKPKR